MWIIAFFQGQCEDYNSFIKVTAISAIAASVSGKRFKFTQIVRILKRSKKHEFFKKKYIMYDCKPEKKRKT